MSDCPEELNLLVDLFSKYDDEQLFWAFKNSIMCSSTGILKHRKFDAMNPQLVANLIDEIHNNEYGAESEEQMDNGKVVTAWIYCAGVEREEFISKLKNVNVQGLADESCQLKLTRIPRQVSRARLDIKIVIK